MLRHEDYTIAWIAILPIEVKAALAALDKRHEDTFGVVRGDDYTYIGGEIAGHNVVIAKLPAGQQYGVGAAAALVSQVKTRFENIWFALLVGIAAGLPGAKDIRLGDVIVCVPDKHCTGIVHYDIGHDTEDGFVTNSRQTEPPALVRAAIGDLQLLSSPFGSDNKLDLLLKEMAPELERPIDTITKIKPNRRPRNAQTRVWYGRIGSGNSLMRNAKRRDELREKFNLIGLEMEAAGVMNTLPTGVIRGVCDYGDSLKNDDWHGYAAAVAAVYGKALLQQIPAKTARDESVQVPRHVMPFMRDPGFVERNAMTTIREKLKPGARVTIVGLGGVGKSQLAIEHCYRAMDCGIQVLWFHASSATRLDQAVGSVIEDLKLPGYDDKSADHYKLLREWLSGQEWLIVLDNADDADFLFRAPVTSKRKTARIDYFPVQGSMLITTRRLTIAQRLSNEKNIIHLSPEIQLATELLRSRLDMPEATAECRKLAEALDSVPLAISQAAAYIKQRQPRCTIVDYLHRLERSEHSRSSLLQVKSDSDRLRRDREEAENSILLTWQISFEHVHALRPSAGDLLALMSFYDNQGIPDFLLRDEHLDSDSEYDVGEASEQDLVVLRDYSFISVTIDGSVLQMHRLVQLAAQVWLKGRSTFGYEQFQAQSLRRLNNQYPRADFEDWGRCRILHTHVRHVCEFNIAGDAADLDRAYIMNKAAWFAAQQGLYLEAETMGLRALWVFERVLGAEHVRTLRSMNNLMDTHLRLGRYVEAEELGIRVLEMRMRLLGEEHTDTLRSMSNLAAALRLQGQYKQAQELGEKVVELQKKVIGEEHRNTVTSMCNLASALRDQGQYKQAQELGEKVVEIKKKVIGEKHPDTLVSMSNLAVTYDEQGRYEEAEQMKSQVFEILQHLLGKEHPHTLVSMNNLAVTLVNQCRVQEASVLMRECSDSLAVVLGDDHPATLTSREWLRIFGKEMHSQDTRARSADGTTVADDDEEDLAAHLESSP